MGCRGDAATSAPERAAEFSPGRKPWVGLRAGGEPRKADRIFEGTGSYAPLGLGAHCGVCFSSAISLPLFANRDATGDAIAIVPFQIRR